MAVSGLYVDKEEKERERSFFSYKDTYYLRKDLIFKCNHNEDLGLQHMNFGGDTNIQPVTTSNTNSFTKMPKSAFTLSHTTQSDTSTHLHTLICLMHDQHIAQQET